MADDGDRERVLNAPTVDECFKCGRNDWDRSIPGGESTTEGTDTPTVVFTCTHCGSEIAY